VQRYLTARSVDEGRESLLLSAYLKIPLQIVIPLIGVLIFAFYLFHDSPLLFNRVHDDEMRGSSRAGEYAAIEAEFKDAHARRRTAAEQLAAARGAGQGIEEAKEAFTAAEHEVSAIRGRAVQLVRDVTGDREYGDVNYVFPTFVTQHMPIGLVGLIIAAIFAAAMSSIAAELNSLSTATVIDFYRRFVKLEASDAHYLGMSKVITGFWGGVACVVAIFATRLGPLIDVVNRFGSFFYGSLLGVFLLAWGVPFATARGAFYGLLAGMATVAAVASLTSIAFLWHNLVGVAAVLGVGLAVSALDRRSGSGARDQV
jgi:uncharacterized sodium:solute symporter family permease YidK